MRLVVEAITVGGGLPEFPGASCCGSAFSVPVGSVSTSEVLRGAKNLRTSTAFGGSLTAEDIGTVFFFIIGEAVLSPYVSVQVPRYLPKSLVGTVLIDFLAVCDVLL
jgi:hypothetical protein